jgi:hypothetical protein
MTRFPLRGARAVGVSLAGLLISAIVLFASLNAARARPAPLANTISSPEQLAAMVIEAMRAGDLDRLRALALTRDEFLSYVWPYLPVSRPEVNMPFDFAWNLLQQKSEGFLRQTIANVEDVPQLRRVEFVGETTDYGDVTVHRESELVVIDDNGEDRRIRLLGSMIEQDGQWKVFSYVVGD